MVVEKQVAFARAWMDMFTEGIRMQQQLALSMFTAATPQQRSAHAKAAIARIAGAGIAPIHRKATANARRLARTKLR